MCEQKLESSFIKSLSKTNDKFGSVWSCRHGSHLIMHRTIGLTGYIGPLILTSVIPVTETQTDTEKIDISKTHTETITEKVFNTDTI